MAVSANIVQFDPNSRRRDRVLLGRLPLSLGATREKSQLILSAFFRVYFDSVDDILFKRADSAANEAEQDIYFDSMRAVRIQRSELLQRVQEGIDRGFASLLDSSEVADADGSESATEQISNVRIDDIESEVAQESFINKTTEANRNALDNLAQRFSSVLDQQIGMQQLPIGPSYLSAIFNEQIARCDLPSEVKVLLYAHLEEKVPDVLQALYHSLNQSLAEASILPQLELKALRESGNTTRSSGLSSVKKVQKVNRELLQPLDERVASVIEMLAEESVNQELIPRETLLSLLTTAQHTVAFDPSLLGQKTTSVVSNALKAHGASGRLARKDAETIKLIGVFFECVFRETPMARIVKVQINRLQIPLIKVALCDKQFFVKTDHYARVFVQSLARLGKSLGTEERAFDKTNHVFQEIVRAVDKVGNDFEKDTGLIRRLADQYLPLARALNNGASEDVAPQKNNRLQALRAATPRVEALVDGMLAGGEIPGVLGLFIDKVWKRVLMRAYVEQGENSEAWKSYCATLEALIFSIQTPSNEEARRKQLELIARIHKNVHVGLQEIAYNPYEVAALLNSLKQLQVAASRRDCLEAADQALAINPVCSESDASKGLSKNAQGDLEVYARRVEALNRGATFVMRKEEGEEITCRLAAMIKASGMYIFVCRDGSKLAEFRAGELAVAMAAGTMVHQESVSNYGDALERVVTGLRKPQDS